MGLDASVEPFRNEHNEEYYDEIKTVVEKRIGSYSALHILRAYAMQKDGINKETIDVYMIGLGWNEEREEAWQKIMEKTTYPHLINHSDCEGYYLPLVEIRDPLWLEEGMTHKVSIGSSIKLYEELLRLRAEMDKDNLTEEHGALVVWKRLFKLAEASVKTGLPIRFH